MTTKECIICVEKLNKSNRLPVECEYCKFTACRECCQRFILNEVQPRCMDNACGREWSRQYIQRSFTQSFVNGDLKIHRQNVLFDREKSLMPATQAVVENEIAIERIREEIRRIDEETRLLAQRRQSLTNEIFRRIHFNERPISENREAAEFHKECPDSNCRGFLSSQWKCGVCEMWTCKECHVIKGNTRDAPHTCDPDILASTKLIAAETRNCPKCRVAIYRIHGCDQMFCTKCNTAFDWRSGRIITGNIHNPHYFEWRNTIGTRVEGRGENEENICGRAVDHQLVLLIRSRFIDKRKLENNERRRYNEYETLVIEQVRNLIEIGDIYVNPRRPDINMVNQKLRVEFMRNNITLENFKKRVQENEKKFMKDLEINNLFEMAYHSLSDIFLRYYSALAKIPVEIIRNNSVYVYPKEVNEIHGEIYVLLKYVNSCFEDIARAYGSSSKYVIKDNISVERVPKNTKYNLA